MLTSWVSAFRGARMDGDAKRIKNQKIEIIDISKLPFGDADQWDKLLCYFGIDLLGPRHRRREAGEHLLHGQGRACASLAIQTPRMRTTAMQGTKRAVRA